MATPSLTFDGSGLPCQLERSRRLWEILRVPHGPDPGLFLSISWTSGAQRFLLPFKVYLLTLVEAYRDFW